MPLRLLLRFLRSQRLSRLPLAEIDLVQHLSGNLRAGVALEEALEGGLKLEHLPMKLHRRIRAVLDLRAESDPLSQILSYSLRGGSPCLPALRQYSHTQRLHLRTQRQLQARTAQGKAQAMISILITPVILIAVGLIDPSLLDAAINYPLSLACFGLTVALMGLGFCWMRYLEFCSLYPGGKECALFLSSLPQFLSRLQVLLQAGTDIESAWRSIQLDPSCPPSYRKFLAMPVTRSLPQDSSAAAIPELKQLHSALYQAYRYGASVSSTLQEIQTDLLEQQEFQQETAAQILPLKLIAPLFLCMLPASLLVLVALLLPMVGQL